MDPVLLSSWSASTGREPSLRVGIVLPADHMQSIRLVLPDNDCRLLVDGREHSMAPAGEAEIVARNGGVSFSAGDIRTVPTSVVTLVPPSFRELHRGRGIEVRGVLTGRGFHWQKRMTFTFSGTLEFRSENGGLLGVNILPMEQYLAGVITSEMSGECPLEFLKSQVLVAR